MRRGIRVPQSWMLVVAILAIQRGQSSLMHGAFAKRNRKTLNELLGSHVLVGFGAAQEQHPVFELLLLPSVLPAL